MTSSKGFNKLVLGAAVVAGLLPTVFANSAFADTSAAQKLSAFQAKYEYNQSEEAGLLATAQSLSSTDPRVPQLRTAVSNIATQVTALFNADQTLIAERPVIPQTADNLRQSDDQLKTKLHTVMNQYNKEVKQIRGMHNGRTAEKQRLNAEMQKLRRQYNGMMNSLKHLQQSLIRDEKSTFSNWRAHPYDLAIPTLQNSVLRLQASEIHYTKEWIYIASAGSTVTGSTYNATSTSSSTLSSQ